MGQRSVDMYDIYSEKSVLVTPSGASIPHNNKVYIIIIYIQDCFFFYVTYFIAQLFASWLL